MTLSFLAVEFCQGVVTPQKQHEQWKIPTMKIYIYIFIYLYIHLLFGKAR